MEKVFLKILEMSITASVLILGIAILRLFLKKIPKNYFCILWAIVAIRLICPISIESIWGLIPTISFKSSEEVYLEPPKNTIEKEEDIIIKDEIISNEHIPNIPNDDEHWDVNINGDENAVSSILLSVATSIWCIGMGLMLCYSIISWCNVRKSICMSIPIGKNRYICDGIQSPFIFGMVKPKIYIPSDLSEEQIQYVVAHEQMHMKRLDHWWNIIGFILLMIYWFNPIIWIGYKLFGHDMEMACDEQVIQKMDHIEISVYLETLLLCSTSKRRKFAYPLAFGETGIKERVKFMATYKKPTWKMMLIASFICIAIVACFGTNKQSSLEQEETEQSTVETTDSVEITYKVEKVEIIEDETVTEGTTWIIGADADAMIFSADGSSENVSRLKMDGVQMYKNAYTLGEDAVTITLQSAYLDRMKVGEHTLTIVYEDGEASITFVVEEKEVETEEFIITEEMLENENNVRKSIATRAKGGGFDRYYIHENLKQLYGIYGALSIPSVIYLSERNHTFQIVISTLSSSQPFGIYEETETELILQDYFFNTVYVFQKEENALVFDKEKSSKNMEWEEFSEHYVPQDEIVEVNPDDYFHIDLPEGITLRQADRANHPNGENLWFLQSNQIDEETTIENAWISMGWIENTILIGGANPYLALGCECYDFEEYDFGAYDYELFGVCEFDVSHISEKQDTSKFWVIWNGYWFFFNQEYFTKEEVIQIGKTISIVEEIE